MVSGTARLGHLRIAQMAASKIAITTMYRTSIVPSLINFSTPLDHSVHSVHLSVDGEDSMTHGLR